MEIFLGSLLKLAIDPILIGICIFLCIIKVSSLGKTIVITAILYTILLALTSSNILTPVVITASIFASVLDSIIIFSVYNKFFNKNK